MRSFFFYFNDDEDDVGTLLGRSGNSCECQGCDECCE